ncbi:MAG: HAMP domain-containing protein [Planctomycetota bacterium]|jgi:two-component system sensor histidine kinase CpxA|nr:HAMP domain-containing protein [Planctomycetota bacterium]
MTVCSWWRSLSFYWQVYLVMILSFGVIIMVVEWAAEPVIEDLLEGWTGKEEDWHELVIWVVSVCVPSLFVGSILTRMVSRRLENLEAATGKLARGDLGARMERDTSRDNVFDRLAVNFNSMAESLENLMKGEKRLLADISHELRSPLTRLGIGAELLERKAKDGESLSAILTMQAELEHMNELVGALLQRGRERMDLASDVARLDLTAILRDIGGHFSRLAKEEGKSVSVDIDDGLAMWGTIGRIRTIFENVLENAEFYSFPGGEIHFTARRDGQLAVATVRDFGPGVPQDQLRNIFRAFVRVDPSRARSSGGAGLGLTLAHEAVDWLGGGISARNASPGLEISILLPLSAEEQIHTNSR